MCFVHANHVCIFMRGTELAKVQLQEGVHLIQVEGAKVGPRGKGEVRDESRGEAVPFPGLEGGIVTKIKKGLVRQKGELLLLMSSRSSTRDLNGSGSSAPLCPINISLDWRPLQSKGWFIN